jgi:Kef-type K+ transport system membrane component KefB
VLLLQIGLETRLADLIKVGAARPGGGQSALSCPSCWAPMWSGPWLLPGLSANAYLFLGATLAATSVGITGRVFRDLGKLDTPAARIVLGAAVIDDVLGLVILAVVSSLVQAGSVSVGQVGGIIAEAVIFLAGSIWIGRLIAPHSSRWLAQLDAGPSMLFAQVLATGPVPRLAGPCHRPGADHRRLCRRPAVRADVPARLRPSGHRARDRAAAAGGRIPGWPSACVRSC